MTILTQTKLMKSGLVGRMVQAFDLADITNQEGAASFGKAAQYSSPRKSRLACCLRFKPLLSFDRGRTQHAKKTIAAIPSWQELGQLSLSGHSAQNSFSSHFECY